MKKYNIYQVVIPGRKYPYWNLSQTLRVARRKAADARRHGLTCRIERFVGRVNGREVWEAV